MDTSNDEDNECSDSEQFKEVRTPLLVRRNGHGLGQNEVNTTESKANNNTNGFNGDALVYDTRTVCFIDGKDGTETVLAKRAYCIEDPPDGGWGWVITFCAFMVGVILDGIAFSFGLFFIDLCEYFQESKSLTAWISSVYNGTYMSIGPLTSVLVSIFGCRKVVSFGAVVTCAAFFFCTWSPNVQVMIILYGLVAGAGMGMMYLPTLVTVGHYFKKKRALATGIAVCGSGIGGFIFAPLSQYLIEMYTWKGAMWIIAAICLNGVVIGTLLRPIESIECASVVMEFDNRQENDNRKQNNNRQETGQDQKLIKNECLESEVVSGKRQCCDASEFFDFSLLKSLTFLVYGCSCFLCMLGFFIPFIYIPDLTEDQGMSKQQGAVLISIIGILNTVSRVLVGWTADRSWADALVLNNVALVIGGLATMFVPYYANFGVMATYSVVFGSTIAVFVSLRSVIMAELLGIQKLNTSLGLVTLCQGLSTFIGSPIAGALSDVTGNYEGAFYLAGAAICLSGIICFPLRRISKWENRRMYGEDGGPKADV